MVTASKKVTASSNGNSHSRTSYRLSVTLHPVAERLAEAARELLAGLPKEVPPNGAVVGIIRDFGPGEAAASSAVLDAIDARPVLFQTVRKGRSTEPFDTATPRKALERYSDQAALRELIAPLIGSLGERLDRNLASLASEARAGIGRGYEMAREVAGRDDAVGEALEPAVKLSESRAQTRRTKTRAAKARLRETVQAAATADKATRAKAKADQAAAKVATTGDEPAPA